jgi:hypothetical protein
MAMDMLRGEAQLFFGPHAQKIMTNVQFLKCLMTNFSTLGTLGLEVISSSINILFFILFPIMTC